MFGKTITTVKTKTKEESSKKRGGRKKCPEGPNCVYKHEYQHDLEFSHDEVAENSGKNKKASPNVLPWQHSGGGHRLGASASLRNTFVSDAGGNGNSSCSSIGKTEKSMIRAIRATAASAREASALPSHTQSNSAGGCGRDGSGIFALPKKPITSNLNLKIDSSSSFSSSSGNSGNSSCSSNSNSSNNSINSSCNEDTSTKRKDIIINLDSEDEDDDEDDEIVFLGSAKNKEGGNFNSSKSFKASIIDSKSRDSLPQIVTAGSRMTQISAVEQNCGDDFDFYRSMKGGSSSSSSGKSRNIDINNDMYIGNPGSSRVFSTGPDLSRQSSDSRTREYSSSIYDTQELGQKRKAASPILIDQIVKVECEICKKMVHINSLDYHLRRHELTGDDVKHKQDREYERSVQEEILKRTAKEAEAQAEEKEKKRALEEAEYSEIMKESVAFAHKAEMEHFRKNLRPEPGITDSEDSFRIRFCLPAPADRGKPPSMLIRRFRTDSSFQDAISFLRSQESLLGIDWMVRMSVGEEEFSIKEKRTFRELGIFRDTSLLVISQIHDP